jgi:hypothetical protein
MSFQEQEINNEEKVNMINRCKKNGFIALGMLLVAGASYRAGQMVREFAPVKSMQLIELEPELTTVKAEAEKVHVLTHIPRKHALKHVITPFTRKSKLKRVITVKLTCNWLSSKGLADLWNKMTQGGGRWGRIQVVWNDPNPDYYVVINQPGLNDHIDPAKTFVFRMEPGMEKDPKWGEWMAPDENKFLKVFYHAKEYNNIEWHISKTYTELKEMKVSEKGRGDMISTVLSAKYQDPGHKKRIDFVKYLDKISLSVDVYGTDLGYKNYKGGLPYHTKDNGLMQYRYHFQVENQSIENYFTEKLIDGILSFCLVFYSGHKSVMKHIDPRAYIYLELNDFEHDADIIKQAIANHEYEKRLPYIIAAREKILDEMQFFPRLEREIELVEEKI